MFIQKNDGKNIRGTKRNLSLYRHMAQSSHHTYTLWEGKKIGQ